MCQSNIHPSADIFYQVSSGGHLSLKALPTSIQKVSNFWVACMSLYFSKYSCRKSSCSLVDHPFCFFSSFGFTLDFLRGCAASLCEVWANIAPRERSRVCELLETWQQRRDYLSVHHSHITFSWLCIPSTNDRWPFPAWVVLLVFLLDAILIFGSNSPVYTLSFCRWRWCWWGCWKKCIPR